MTDILTACLANEEATVRALLTGKGQTYVATYSPFSDDVISLSVYVAPNINFGGDIDKSGSKVLVHTKA